MTPAQQKAAREADRKARNDKIIAGIKNNKGAKR